MSGKYKPSIIGAPKSLGQLLIYIRKELLAISNIVNSKSDDSGSFNPDAYLGTWDAEKNIPDIVGTTPENGSYYIVSAAGDTALNGIDEWEIGDQVIFAEGQGWQKIPAPVGPTPQTIIEPINPVFTWVDDVLRRIDYDDGLYKIFVYSDEVLTQLTYFNGVDLIIKSFVYDSDGLLTEINQTTS